MALASDIDSDWTAADVWEKVFRATKLQSDSVHREKPFLFAKTPQR